MVVLFNANVSSILGLFSVLLHSALGLRPLKLAQLATWTILLEYTDGPIYAYALNALFFFSFFHAFQVFLIFLFFSHEWSHLFRNLMHVQPANFRPLEHSFMECEQSCKLSPCICLPSHPPVDEVENKFVSVTICNTITSYHSVWLWAKNRETTL